MYISLSLYIYIYIYHIHAYRRAFVAGVVASKALFELFVVDCVRLVGDMILARLY